jgi:hypothetical protein
MSQPTDQPNPAARLLQALTRSDDLDHTTAQAQLPALIEAELAGADVDELPQFQALLAHLDHCAECLDLYEALAADAALLISDEPLPNAPVPPTLLTPAIQRDGLLVRLLQGLRRQLEINLNLPNLVPVSSGSGPVTLISETLTSNAGSLDLIVWLNREAQPPLLQVTLHPATAQSEWLVQLQIDDQRFAATTQAGIATLQGFTAAQLQNARQLALQCIEQTRESPSD